MTYRNNDQPETLPDPWQSPVTGQIFRPFGRWHKPGVELIDWMTNCRKCGEDHSFVLRADHPDNIAAHMSVRWHSLCRSCRMGAGR